MKEISKADLPSEKVIALYIYKIYANERREHFSWHYVAIVIPRFKMASSSAPIAAVP